VRARARVQMCVRKHLTLGVLGVQAQKLNQTRHEINRVISPTKGLY